MNMKIGNLSAVLALGMLVGGCGLHKAQTTMAPDTSIKPVMVQIINGKNEKVGTAEFAPTDKGVALTVKVSNLPPGTHGIHIHEFPKCEGPDFKTAGAHFNPQMKKHGFKNPEGYHAGDMLNLEVDSKGMATYTTTLTTATLSPGANSLLDGGGKALVIHAKADDYYTDPAGNSGDRIACGVISAQK